MNEIVITALIVLALFAALWFAVRVLAARTRANPETEVPQEIPETVVIPRSIRSTQPPTFTPPYSPAPATTTAYAISPDPATDLLNPLNPFSPLWIGSTVATESAPASAYSHDSDYAAPTPAESYKDHHSHHDVSSYTYDTPSYSTTSDTSSSYAPDTTSYSSSSDSSPSSSYDSGSSSSSDSGSSSSSDSGGW